MDFKEEKKKRGKNFSSEEEVVLVDLVEANKNILTNKRTDAVTWRQKEQCWHQLAVRFAAKTGVNREWKALRDKFDNMKRTSKIVLASEKRGTYRTGGGIKKSKVADLSLRVASLMGSSATGLHNSYDGDASEFFGEETVADDDILLIDANVKEETITSDDNNENASNWASCNPTSLQQPKSKRLRADNSTGRKRDIDEEKMSLILLQQDFYKGEIVRAEEKHQQETRHAEEKHQHELATIKLRNELLQLEIEKKKTFHIEKCLHNSCIHNDKTIVLDKH